MKSYRDKRRGKNTWLHLVFRVALLTAILLLCSCDKVTSPEEWDPFKDVTSDENAGWVAIVAKVNYVDHIYLIDYNNPTIYKRISPGISGEFSEPTFFRDRSKVLFRWDYSPSSGWMVYDIETDTATFLTFASGELISRAHKPLVFPPGEEGFYYAWATYGGGYNVAYYRFQDSTVTFLTAGDYRTYPVAIFDDHTLIVYSDDTANSGGSPGFYFMGTDGTYGERLLNSYLEGAEVFTWHETLGLGAFVEHGPETSSPTMQERYIAVTNLGGSYYHRFTEGPYDDQLPTWGPGGGVLLFRRQDVNMGWELPTRIMKINLRTEEIEQLVEPKTVDGSTYHSWPHYQY